MSKPKLSFKKGEIPDYCIHCGGQLPDKHKKSGKNKCPLTEELQQTLGQKVFCPLCGQQVVGAHNCNG